MCMYIYIHVKIEEEEIVEVHIYKLYKEDIYAYGRVCDNNMYAWVRQ